MKISSLFIVTGALGLISTLAFQLWVSASEEERVMNDMSQTGITYAVEGDDHRNTVISETNREQLIPAIVIIVIGLALRTNPKPKKREIRFSGNADPEMFDKMMKEELSSIVSEP